MDTDSNVYGTSIRGSNSGEIVAVPRPDVWGWHCHVCSANGVGHLTKVSAKVALDEHIFAHPEVLDWKWQCPVCSKVGFSNLTAEMAGKALDAHYQSCHNGRNYIGKPQNRNEMIDCNLRILIDSLKAMRQNFVSNIYDSISLDIKSFWRNQVFELDKIARGLEEAQRKNALSVLKPKT